MPDTDLFDPDRWRMNGELARTPAPPGAQKRARRPPRPGRFLKGPVPWPWLVRAMTLPGKALAVGLMLWRQRGVTGSRTISFCLAHAAADGIPTTTARRAMRALERACLVSIARRPGRGLMVTLDEYHEDSGRGGGPTDEEVPR